MKSRFGGNMWAGVVCVLVAASTLHPREASARLQAINWYSACNLVVRPSQDSQTFSGGETKTVEIAVQNNMGYPLPNLELTAAVDGYTVNVDSSGTTTKVANMFLPGKTLTYQLEIAPTGGADMLVMDELEFEVSFGGGD